MNIYLRRNMELQANVKEVAPFDIALQALEDLPQCTGRHESVPRRRSNIGAGLVSPQRLARALTRYHWEGLLG